MGLLDFIFGNDEDDLEKTETKHPLESVPGWSRPMGATTNDPQVGEDDAGNPVFRTALGRTYTVRVNPDQRTIRQKVTDAAPAVVEAVKDYAQNPTLPTAEQVGQFAYDATVGAAEDLDNIMFKGEGTIGDALSLASGVGLGARGANVAAKAITGNGIAPEGEPGTVLGLFLPAVKNTKYQSNIDRANELKALGATRDEIWEETGLWQLAEKGEWLTEIDDSKAEIALTAKFNNTKMPKQYKTETVIEERPVKTGGLTDQERLSAKIQTRKIMLEIRDRLARGEIDQQTAKDLAREAQQKLDEAIAAEGKTEYEQFEVTKKVEIPRKPLTPGRGPTMQGGKSTLDEVLFHDGFFAEMKEMGIDVSSTTAEAGRRKDSSAGESASGVQYRREPGPFIDKNRVSSFKNAAGWKNSPRNSADEELVQLWRDGKIPEEQVDAEMILSTMLHEVQHLIDAEVKSDTGTGFNDASSPRIRGEMTREFEKNLRNMVNLDTSISERTALSLMHELIYNPIEVDGIIGGTLLSPSKSEKFSISDILDSVYGSEPSFAKDEITDLGNVKNMAAHHVLNLGKIFDKWREYTTVMASFPPDHINHNIAKQDAKMEFIHRVSGTVPSDSGSADFYNSNSIMGDMVGPNNVDNKRARANVFFHLLDSGELNDVMDKYYKTMKSGLAQNIKASDEELYYLEGGETKSRLVQARRDMSAKDRKATPPYKMLDRDEERIWFADVYNNYNPSTKDQ